MLLNTIYQAQENDNKYQAQQNGIECYILGLEK